MAEEGFQSRTEAPTPRRREEARQQGRVALSSELSGGLILLAGVAALWLGASALAGGMLDTVRQHLVRVRPFHLEPEQVPALLAGLFGRGAELVGYFFALMFAMGIGIGILQAGFQVAPEAIALRWEKLSPANGWSRIFSVASLMRGVVVIVKLSLVTAIAYWVLKGRAPHVLALGGGSVAGSASQGWDLAMRLALAIVAALVLIGVADYGFQRWRHEQSLYMTRTEAKEESRREEGDPQIKARVRKLQREAARRRMLTDVPRATVVVTNPTHLAVALLYERDKMAAPKLVAKGAGHIAQRIVELARRHAVPVIERKPVAQALYKAVKVGQEIPAGLYYVVAEVLAYLYRLRGA